MAEKGREILRKDNLLDEEAFIQQDVTNFGLQQKFELLTGRLETLTKRFVSVYITTQIFRLLVIKYDVEVWRKVIHGDTEHLSYITGMQT